MGGFLVGGPLGAIGGAIFGGLGGGGICIIHEAAYGRESREVAIARRFRDRHMSTPALRAYYALYGPIAKRMREDEPYRAMMRDQLVNRLVRYGAAVMKMDYPPPDAEDRRVARAFITHLEAMGVGFPSPYFREDTAEWV